jgi:hypothetical protein
MVGEPEPVYGPLGLAEHLAIIQKKADETIDKVPGGGLRPAPPQDREAETSVQMLLQLRGGRDETPHPGEDMNRTLEWVCKSREPGTATVQKILIPDWAKSYKLSLELSSEPRA